MGVNVGKEIGQGSKSQSTNYRKLTLSGSAPKGNLRASEQPIKLFARPHFEQSRIARTISGFVGVSTPVAPAEPAVSSNLVDTRCPRVFWTLRRRPLKSYIAA